MTRLSCALAAVSLLIFAPDALAQSGGSRYWTGFKEFWFGAIQRQSGVVLFAVGMGILCIFIITRNKWKK